MSWNKEQVAAFATYAHMEGWVAKANGKGKDSPIFGGSVDYLTEKAGFVDRNPDRPESALDLSNLAKFKQMMGVLSKVV